MTDRRTSANVSMAIITVTGAFLLLGGVAQGYSGIEHAWLGVKS